jgi:hypothetical protein
MARCQDPRADVHRFFISSGDATPTESKKSTSHGIGQGIQTHLRHAKADTTANEYMQELPESVQQMMGSVYLMRAKGGEDEDF